MKNVLMSIVIVVAAAVAFGIEANAQASQLYRAQVPFDFTVGDRTYEAGKYRVGAMGPSNRAVVMEDLSSGRSRILGIQSGNQQAGKNGRLIFIKIGNRYTLSEVVTPSFGIKMKHAWKEGLVAARQRTTIEVPLD